MKFVKSDPSPHQNHLQPHPLPSCPLSVLFQFNGNRVVNIIFPALCADKDGDILHDTLPFLSQSFFQNLFGCSVSCLSK